LPIEVSAENITTFMMEDVAYTDLRHERLPDLLLDQQWRDHAMMTISALVRAHEAAIARWASMFGVLGDEEGFRAVARSVSLLDLAESVQQHLFAVQEAREGGAFQEA